MQIPIRLMSYYEVSTGFGARIGAGEPDDVLNRRDRDPSVRLCFREPAPNGTGTRLRFGSATLTDGGPVPNPFKDDTERQGAWGGTLTIAIQAMQSLTESTQDALATLPLDPATTWWLLDSRSHRLRQVAGPDREWIERDAPAQELLAEVLIRLSGSADAVIAIVSGLRSKLSPS